jgi:hypothetical protein
MNEIIPIEKDLHIAVDQSGIYRIKIQGRLSSGIQGRFDEMMVSVEQNPAGVPITTLTGQIADQAALHGLVARIRDLGLPLLLVELVRPIEQGG